MSEWQPIETAPKDGRPIIGFDARYRDTIVPPRHDEQADLGEPERWSPFEIVCWVIKKRIQWIMDGPNTKRRSDVDWSGWERSQGCWFPTHWMPLPEPPRSPSILSEAVPTEEDQKAK